MLNKILLVLIAVFIVIAFLVDSSNGLTTNIGDTYFVYSPKTIFIYLAYLGIIFLIGRLVIGRLRSS